MNYLAIPGLKAGANISANQFEAVKMGTADFTVIAITANTDKPVGILQDDPNASGQSAEVAHVGVCKARYGGTVTRGDLLSVDTDGELVAVTPGTDTTRFVIALAMESGADQEVRFVQLMQQGRAA